MTIYFLSKKSAIHQCISIFVLLLLPAFVHAQNQPASKATQLRTQEISRKGKYYSRQSATVDTQKTYNVAPGFIFTSLALRISPTESFAGAYVIADADTFYLQHDEHQPKEDTLLPSNLVIFPHPRKQVLFVPGQIQGAVDFSFINAGSGTDRSRQGFARQQKRQASQDSCSQPAVVPQSTWRDGLPAPSYQRIRTNVQHMIVHHSATYNNLTDYANVVRNIYLFHTKDRGWSDIGYNYLIAQDGTIFEGRSPGGQDVLTDNIQGAHLCSKNSGTMGICVLGNYETATPTTASLASLESLIAWKADKDNLNPLGESYHVDAMLATIAGHRDGCDTECPGKNLYAKLGEIRMTVAERITHTCDPVTFNVYADYSTNTLYVHAPDLAASQQVLLYDMQGKRMNVPLRADTANSRWLMDFTQLSGGVYIVELQSKDFTALRKVLLLPGS